MSDFTNPDIIVLLLYFALVISFGLYAAKKNDETISQYFLAGKKMGWFVIGASLFVTNISSEHIVGLAGSGARNGLIVGHFEWMAILALIMLGWVFAPIFIRSGIFTIPEFLENRYGKSSRMYLATVSIIAYITTKISVMLYAGGYILHALLGWDIYTSSIVLVILTGIYTIAGGLRSVLYTGVVQLVFLISGAFILVIVGLQEVGGFYGLQEKLPNEFFHMLRPISDPDFPWTGVLFGAPIIGIWYWCTDQYIVQRILSAKNINHAQKATIFAGFLKITPVFLFILPGMIAAALYPNVSGENAFTLLLAELPLIPGVRGLIMAGILAALMSSLSAVFNSTATIITLDFYKNFYPNSSERKLVLVGRLSAILIAVAGIFWVPLTTLLNANIYLYMQSVQAYISPPIAAVFIFGVFSNRVKAKAAFATLLFGGVLGALRFVFEIYNNFYPISFTPLQWFVELNFLHFAIILFIVSTIVLFAVSVPLKKGYAIDKVFQSSAFVTMKEGLSITKTRWLRMNFIWSAVLVALLLGLWEIFL